MITLEFISSGCFTSNKVIVTFRGSQVILPKLTSKRTKFNSIPRGSKGQAIAQTHKGFLHTANNFITSEIACLSSEVAEFWRLRCIVVRTKKGNQQRKPYVTIMY